MPGCGPRPASNFPRQSKFLLQPLVVRFVSRRRPSACKGSGGGSVLRYGPPELPPGDQQALPGKCWAAGFRRAVNRKSVTPAVRRLSARATRGKT